MKGIKKTARILASITQEQWEAVLTLSEESKEFMKKDFLTFFDKLGENTNIVNQAKETPERVELLAKIKMLMNKCGIPIGSRGYTYFVEAIILVYEDNGYADLVTKRLYPDVAKKHNIDARGVERSMHYCLCKAFKNSDNSFNAKVFKNIPKKNGIPANRSFIIGVVEYLKST